MPQTSREPFDELQCQGPLLAQAVWKGSVCCDSRDKIPGDFAEALCWRGGSRASPWGGSSLIRSPVSQAEIAEGGTIRFGVYGLIVPA